MKGLKRTIIPLLSLIAVLVVLVVVFRGRGGDQDAVPAAMPVEESSEQEEAAPQIVETTPEISETEDIPEADESSAVDETPAVEESLAVEDTLAITPPPSDDPAEETAEETAEDIPEMALIQKDEAVYEEDDSGIQTPSVPEPDDDFKLHEGESAILPDDWKNFVRRSSESIDPPGKKPSQPKDNEPVKIAVEPAAPEVPVEEPELAAIADGETAEPPEVVVLEEPAVITIAPPEPEVEKVLPEEPVSEEPPELEVVLNEGPQILIDSPRPGGYYRSSLLLEGKCIPLEEDDKDSRVRSLTWKIPGMGEYTNTVFMDEDGGFQMDLMTAGLEGSQTLILESEDFAGRISRQSFMIQDGNQPPGIITDVDSSERVYGALLSIKGQLDDPYKGIAELEGIQSLTFRLVPQDRELGNEVVNGTIPVKADGSFSIALNMEDRLGEQMLQLRATGNNESREILEIRLVPGRGDIPSFAMEPQDGRLIFSWEEIDGTLEQNLYLNNTPGAEPEDNPVASFTNIQSPLVIDRTVNGKLYRAKLEILTEEGRFWSEVSEAVPLAPGTLGLRAEGGFEQVRLSWNTISAVDSFRIWRRTEDETEYSLLVDNHRGQEYIDATATYGIDYYYRIEPAAVSGPLSYDVPAASTESPSEKITLSSHYRQIIPEKISVQGDYAYIAAGDGGFHIMDISIPQKPESIGFLDQKGVQDVYLGEEYVYLASGDEGFQVVNIEEPTRPYTVLSRVTPGALSVAGRGDFVFLADSQLGLQIFDISDRQNPQRLSTLRDIKITQLDLQDEYLYGAAGDDGMVLIDISNPYNPQLVMSLSDFPVHDILVQDGLIYLACGEQGMIIYEKTSDSEWNELSRFASQDARMIRLWEDYAMIADGEGGMKAVDVSDPLEPRNFGIFGGTEVKALAMADDYALLADIGGLKVVRTYLFGQSFVQHRWESPGRAYAVMTEGDRLWVTDRQGGVSVYQSSSPANMKETSLIRHFDTDFAEDILLKDDVLYVADGPGGVKLFRLSDSSPEPMLVHPVTGRARRIIPYGSQLAVVASGEGLLFLDENTADNHTLSYASRFYSTDPRDAAFYGSSLFLGDNKDGLILAEKLDNQFMEIERLTEYQGIRQLLLRGDILYVLHDKGVTLLDIRNPDHPVVKALIPGNNAESMQLKGELFYLSEGFKGLSVYRIDEALQPLKVSVCEDIFAVDAAPEGSFAYVADMEGISVLKVIIPDWK